MKRAVRFSFDEGGAKTMVLCAFSEDQAGSKDDRIASVLLFLDDLVKDRLQAGCI